MWREINSNQPVDVDSIFAPSLKLEVMKDATGTWIGAYYRERLVGPEEEDGMPPLGPLTLAYDDHQTVEDQAKRKALDDVMLAFALLDHYQKKEKEKAREWVSAITTDNDQAAQEVLADCANGSSTTAPNAPQTHQD